MFSNLSSNIRSVFVKLLTGFLFLVASHPDQKYCLSVAVFYDIRLISVMAYLLQCIKFTCYYLCTTLYLILGLSSAHSLRCLFQLILGGKPYCNNIFGRLSGNNLLIYSSIVIFSWHTRFKITI